MPFWLLIAFSSFSSGCLSKVIRVVESIVPYSHAQHASRQMMTWARFSLASDSHSVEDFPITCESSSRSDDVAMEVKEI